MEPRISLVTLGVRDIVLSRRFYETLGWRASPTSNENVVFFQAGGMALGLYGREALADDAQLTLGSGFGGVTLAQNMRSRAEVDGVLAEVAAAGGRILKPAQDVFWGGYSGYFADPDGHAWEIAWNPFFTLETDGRLTLP